MKTVRFVLQPLLDLFARLRALTMPEMKTALGTDVDLTVFRKLAQLPARTSYSHRGSFYTLDSIARFDEQGLWCCRGAWFSRHGTLLDTAEAFVRAAPTGYLARELDATLHVATKDALRHLVEQRRLQRQAHGPLYLYTAPERSRRQEQSAARHALAEARDPEEEQSRAAIVLFYSLLDEQQRRLYAGLESLKRGHGGDQSLAESLGLDVATVARGRRELLAGQVQRDRVRRAGAGRPRAEKKRPLS
jgi:hypothetical protein